MKRSELINIIRNDALFEHLVESFLEFRSDLDLKLIILHTVKICENNGMLPPKAKVWTKPKDIVVFGNVMKDFQQKVSRNEWEPEEDI
jgi:hypothetical protein